MTAYRLPYDWNHDLKNAVCEWLKANDIEPEGVPMRSEVTITDGVIAYYEQIPANGIQWHARKKPLISPLPEGLAAQWRVPPTLCPHCGEDINDTPTGFTAPFNTSGTGFPGPGVDLGESRTGGSLASGDAG